MRFTGVICTAVIALGISVSASATLITDVEYPQTFLKDGESKTINHDLTDDGVPDDYKVNSAGLKLGFSDGLVFQDWTLDLASVSGAGLSGVWEVDGTHAFGYDVRLLGVGPDGISSLNTSGQLEVTVTALDHHHNDFWWKTSKLKASAEPANVPEPGTLALLGLGLVGMGVTYRRRNRAGIS